jgi:hypothetical protein
MQNRGNRSYRLGGDVDDPSRIIAVLRGHVIRHHLKLLDYLLRRNKAVQSVSVCIGRDAIHMKLALISKIPPCATTPGTNVSRLYTLRPLSGID